MKAQISGFTTSVLIILVIIIPLILLAGYFFAKILVKPLQDLTEAANKVATGEVDIQLVTKTEDEIGKLNKSFAIMIGNIKESSLLAEKFLKVI